MTRARIIPVLLLANCGMVKTMRFAQPRYLGDPINAVRIFNDKQVDELMLLDIEATRKKQINFDWIEEIISEAFMPVAYGGGISSVDQCAELFSRGIEKIVINSSAVQSPTLISAAAERFGSQSVVVSMDVRNDMFGRSRVYTDGGRRKTRFIPTQFARTCEQLGAGEIIVTSIAREGTFEGYDLTLLGSVCRSVRVPIIANGGAGRIEDFAEAITAGCSAVAAGSLFVFAAKGEGVLISYPSQAEVQRQWNGRLA